MSGIIGANNQFGHDFNSPDSSLQGTIVSLYDVSTSLSRGCCNAMMLTWMQIGCALGSLLCVIFGERFGRKRVILAGGSTMIIGNKSYQYCPSQNAVLILKPSGTIILASSKSLAQLLVGRIVTGIGNGFNSKLSLSGYIFSRGNAYKM
jgi:MFS family permease